MIKMAEESISLCRKCYCFSTTIGGKFCNNCKSDKILAEKEFELSSHKRGEKDKGSEIVW